MVSTLPNQMDSASSYDDLVGVIFMTLQMSELLTLMMMGMVIVNPLIAQDLSLHLKLNNLYQDCLVSSDLEFPNQPEYFDEPYDNQGTDTFDYNCHNDVQLQYPDVISCDQDFGSGTLCGLEEDNTGWFDTVPDCGEYTNFADEDGICVNNLPTDTKC